MSSSRSGLSLPLLLAAARKVYPEWKLGTLKNRFSLVWAGLQQRAPLRALLARDEHRALREEARQFPETLGFVVWPYIHAGWPVLQRFDALSQHRQALLSDMAALDVGRDGSVVVADLSAVSPGLRLVVDRAPWCLREGSLVFNQFVNDERLMTMAFSFGWQNGERIVYVGSVQGSNADSALATYREIAKDLQGMRSRDFLIKAFQLLMFHLGVKRILCVADDQRHHRHIYFTRAKNEKFHLNYDEIWGEHAGEPTADGFFRLGMLPVVRPMEEIAAKNRALYRRRYAMMDQLSADLAARFSKASKQDEAT